MRRAASRPARPNGGEQPQALCTTASRLKLRMMLAAPLPSSVVAEPVSLISTWVVVLVMSCPGSAKSSVPVSSPIPAMLPVTPVGLTKEAGVVKTPTSSTAVIEASQRVSIWRVQVSPTAAFTVNVMS
jgi:hypothetical protein